MSSEKGYQGIENLSMLYRFSLAGLMGLLSISVLRRAKYAVLQMGLSDAITGINAARSCHYTGLYRYIIDALQLGFRSSHGEPRREVMPNNSLKCPVCGGLLQRDTLLPNKFTREAQSAEQSTRTTAPI